MKAGSATFVEHAHVVLARAGVMLTAGLNEDAARAAYMASFHVAQAYIFERTDKVSKSHKGVQIEFFRLSQIDPRVDAGSTEVYLAIIRVQVDRRLFLKRRRDNITAASD